MFTTEDMTTLATLVADTWRAAADRDWSVPAGTLEWSCHATAIHAVDCVFAPAAFLASRRTDDYPPYGFFEPDPEKVPPLVLAEACEAAARILNATVREAGDDVRAVIWRRPAIETRPPADFVPRGALELILHAHDVCTGLGVDFTPPTEICELLRQHVQHWPYFTPAGGWPALAMTGDPWDDLLQTSGRR